MHVGRDHVGRAGQEVHRAEAGADAAAVPERDLRSSNWWLKGESYWVVYRVDECK